MGDVTMYRYNSTIKLGHVALNVNNLEHMIKYYTTVIGFTLKNQTDSEALLGFDGSDDIFLRLLKTEKRQESHTYGLYHFAILVSNRTELASSLYHLLLHRANIEGASDHHYSEAIYITDPENNGIEIYCDRDESLWNVQSDGKIIGTTEPLDAQELLTHARRNEPFRLNAHTEMGHIHLSARYALESSRLYQDIFPIEDKFSIPTGSWIASGRYHHHLAFNHWAGHGLKKREVDEPGLAYFTIIFNDKEAYDVSIKRAAEKLTIIESNSNAYLFEDTDGMRCWVVLE